MSRSSGIEAFTIRVYGLLIHQEQILLSRENIYGKPYLKLPGGGMEFGEGTLDCLKREFQEECKLDIQVKDHFYTTEDFVPSAFSSRVQVMSIYYFVEAKDLSPLLKLSSEKSLQKHGDQILYWRNLAELSSEEMDLPIDRQVIRKLLNLR